MTINVKSDGCKNFYTGSCDGNRMGSGNSVRFIVYKSNSRGEL